MDIDPAAAYKALLSRDSRFDGRFFVGVRSTGIYCRPVCRVRAPRPDSCRYYDNAAAAEAAGFRPCLRCRPELAPGLSLIDSPDALAVAAARLIDAGSGAEGMAALAGRVGVGERHLRRVFQARFGVTPIAYAQTQRLLLAKRLLSDSAMPMAELALAAGFSSLRRFNALFRERYRMAPSALRRGRAPRSGDSIELGVGYRPPYDWTGLLDFLRYRALPGVESVGEQVYRRTVCITHGGRIHQGWFELRHDPERQRLLLHAASSLGAALAPLLAGVRRQFDLDCDPEPIAAALGALAEPRPGLRLPGCFDAFEQAVRAILGQQVSVAAATTLAGRLVHAYGAAVATPWPGLSRRFPGAATVAQLPPEALSRIGILPARARSILALAQALDDGRLRLQPEGDPAPQLALLRELPGIGDWTAQYLAMRCLSWPDAFPHTDLIIRRAFPGMTPSQVLRAAEAWRPWRSYACLHLWRAST